MPDPNLIALYETKRQNFLTAFIQNPDRFSKSLAYAYEKRLDPIFNEQIQRETYEADPFADVYAVKGDFIEELLKHIDTLDSAGKHDELGFYTLEGKFGGNRASRMEIAAAIEYMRIDGRFNAKVYMAIESDAPMEVNPIASTFGPNDVYFG